VRTVAALCTLGLLPACPTVTDWTGEDLDISEVLFRYLFEHNASFMQRLANAYYLEINGVDPPREFLGRFAGNTPPVKPASRFRLGAGRGLLFGLEAIERVTSEEVEVSAFYKEGFSQQLYCLSSWDYTLTLTREEDRWVVQPPPVSPWEGEDLDICEAAVKDLIEGPVSYNVSAYFLKIDWLDPSPEFLERFEDCAPPVEPGSQFQYGGFLLNVLEITWTNEEEAIVRTNVYMGALSQSGYDSYVVYQNGQWIVVDVALAFQTRKTQDAA